MNDDELWTAIDSQRLRTVALLRELSPADWDHASLCEGWRVRDVAAHLTMQQMTVGDALKGLLRHPAGLGSMNHMISALAVSEANRRTPDELISAISGMVGSRRHNVGVTAYETLIDIVIHGQDIAIPLGRRLEVPADTAATTATRVWASLPTRKVRMLGVFKPVPYRSYRLVATDVEWTVGEGPEIRGPILAILLLLTGRTAGYADLAGPGAATLGAALGVAPT